MEQFNSSVEESFKVLEQQQRNDEQQCPSCAAEPTEASVWMIAASETDCMGWSNQRGSLAVGNNLSRLQAKIHHISVEKEPFLV